MNNPFASLKYKNFRYYSIGMVISMFGTWMQSTAQPWLAYSLTKSPLLLSLVGVVQFTPVLLLSLFAGIVIDKFPKKKILFFTQSASLAVTLTLGILTLTGVVQYWHILMCAFFMGLINTLDNPTRQTFAVELVEQDSLMNAIALNSTVFNLARIAGPSIAGIMMAVWGVGSCFIFNSISFAAVIISLYFIHPREIPHKPAAKAPMFHEIKGVLRYIADNAIVLEALIVLAIVGTFAPNFNVLIPVFAKIVLKQTETGYGLLMSALGLGSLLGSIFIAARSKTGPKQNVIRYFPFLVGAALMITGLTTSYVMTALFTAITGFFFVSFSSSLNSTIQLNINNENRGKVMSVYALIFAGSTPFGNLYAGILSDKLNPRWGYIGCGLITVVLMVPVLLKLRKKHTSQLPQACSAEE